LKNKPRKLAKSTTEAEFIDNMREIVQRATTFWQPKGFKPFFCFDNAKIQVGADPASYGMEPWQRLPLAPYSPDFNRCIEHRFAYMKRWVRDHIYWEGEMRGQELNTLELQDVVRAAFKSIPADSVARDAAGLPLLWSLVRGSKGSVVETADGHQHQCSGGYYPEAAYR
jgi:hypothetical protein